MSVDRAAALDVAPRALGTERPGQRVVGQVDVEDLLEPVLQAGVDDRDERLDPAVEVAGHQVGRADVARPAARAGAVGEAEDPRVLEVATDDRAHPDVLGQARHPGTQAADAADDEVDLARRPATPAYSASISAGSTRLFIFIMIRPVPAGAVVSPRISASIAGAQRVRGDEQLAVLDVRARSR